MYADYYLLVFCIEDIPKAKGGECISANNAVLRLVKPKKELLNRGMKQGKVYRLRSHCLL